MSSKPLTYSRITLRQCPVCHTEFFQVGPHLQKYCGPACAKKVKYNSQLLPREERQSTSPRRCLKCGSRFPSTGPENRICKACSRENYKLIDSYSEVALVGGCVAM